MAEPAYTHLLGIPPELRVIILKDVLQHRRPTRRLKSTKDVRFHRSVLSSVPAILHVDRQLRAEVAPLFFATATLHFRTFGELGTALLSSPGTLPWWQNVRIECSGQKEGSWRLDPGVDILRYVPSLKHISLDGIVVVSYKEPNMSLAGVYRMRTVTPYFARRPRPSLP